MEKDRSSKIIAVCGLVVAVAALSVGFAAFTQSLDISSNAYVNPTDTTLDVEFTSSNPIESPEVLNVEGSASSGASALIATIDNDGVHPTISNLGATFTDKGQSVIYSFYVHNASSYIAYLRSVIFNNASSGVSYKFCVAGAETTEKTVNNVDGAACDDISLSIKVGSDTYSSSNSTISSKSLDVDGYQNVVVTILYDGVHELPDGDFSVSFGDISLGYSSIDKS